MSRRKFEVGDKARIVKLVGGPAPGFKKGMNVTITGDGDRWFPYEARNYKGHVTCFRAEELEPVRRKGDDGSKTTASKKQKVKK